MMNNETHTCNSCGRSFPINGSSNQCTCGTYFREYDYTMPSCIRKQKPDCAKKAVIASVTVEKASNMAGICDSLVHVVENNTTYYLDSCGNPIITWAGPIDLPEYDIEGNPDNYRRQLISTTQIVDDPETGDPMRVTVMVYYDGQMRPHLMATDDDVERVLEYAKAEIEQIKVDLDDKQDKLTAGDNIDINDENVISATDTTYKAGNNIVIEYDASVDSNVISAVGSGGAYLAGDNIQISPTNVISATNTTYSAGSFVNINSANQINVDLSNYYNKPEVNQLLSDLDSVSMEVVTALPAVGAPNVIYLLERAGSTVYDQWVFSSGTWHNIGDTSVNLDNYYTKSETYSRTETDTLLTNYYTKNETYSKTETDTLLGNHYTKTEDDTLLADKQDKLTYNSEITTLADTQQVSQVDLTTKKVNFFSLSTLWTWIKNKILTTDTLDDKQDKLVAGDSIDTVGDATYWSQVLLGDKKVNYGNFGTVWQYIKGKINGGASTIVDTNLTTDRALVSNASGKVAVSDITSTELGYLDDVVNPLKLSSAVGSAAIAYNTTTSQGFLISGEYSSDTPRRVWKMGGVATLTFHCKGSASAVSSGWTTIGQVPTGYRPKYITPVVAMVYNGSTNEAAGGYINAAGNLVIWTDAKVATNNYQVRVNTTYMVA